MRPSRGATPLGISTRRLMLRLLFRRRSLRLRSDVQGAKLGVHGLGELGRGAFLEGRVAAVGRGDRVRADRERAGREHRLARAVQRAAAESGRAVLEGHRAARGDPAGALRRHRRGESHRLPEHRRLDRGGESRGGAGTGRRGGGGGGGRRRRRRGSVGRRGRRRRGGGGGGGRGGGQGRRGGRRGRRGGGCRRGRGRRGGRRRRGRGRGRGQGRRRAARGGGG